MVKGARRLFRHRRPVAARPHRLGPALQQVDLLTARRVGRHGPFDVLRAAVVRFDAFANLGKRMNLGIVKRNIVRADTAAVAKLSRFGVATIHEAMGRVGLMYPYMRPIYAGAQACGAAVTALLQPGDNWMMHVVAEQLQPGDVVVAGLDMYKVREPLAAAGLGYID